MVIARHEEIRGRKCGEDKEQKFEGGLIAGEENDPTSNISRFPSFRSGKRSEG